MREAAPGGDGRRRGRVAPAAWGRAVRVAGAALAAAASLGWGGLARAQFTPGNTTDLQADPFEAAPSQGVDSLNLLTTRTLPHLMPSFGLFVHYAKDPLVLSKGDDPDRVVGRLVESSLQGELWASLGLFQWVDLGVVMPVALFRSGGSLEGFGGAPGETVAGVAAGDLRVIPKLRLVNWQRAGGFGLALAAPVWLPTASGPFLGDGAVRAEPSLVLEWRHRSGFAITANAGYAFRPTRRIQNYVRGAAVRWAGGLEIPTGTGVLQFLANVSGEVSMVQDRAPYNPTQAVDDGRANPLDAVLALRFRLPQELVFQLGGGLGLTKGVGSPLFRAFLSFGWAPSSDDVDLDGIRDAEDGCPKEAEDPDGFQDADGCPDDDNDNDGVLDRDDGCPNQPEDRDQWKDEDGCPDEDNDGDGIRDADDECPVRAEDMDGFQDADGCPDEDNDADGLKDAADSCPNEAEDRDGFHDEDGCPDEDNDGDKILDVNDRCPMTPETFNGYQDADGCPDEKPKPKAPPKPSKVRVTKTKIEILEKVFFKTGKADIKSKSYPLLREVAAVIVQHPQITRIRVEGHTDSRGPARYNRKLSQARAESVRDFLVEAGVAPERLEAKGYGEDKPIESNKTKAGRAANRRVEFTIVEVNGKPVGPGPVIIEKTEKVSE